MSNPFRNWSQIDVEKFNAKRGPLVIGDVNLGEGHVDEEIPLHNEILKECERRGWLAFHGSTAHRTHRTVGEFDFIILADGGRRFNIECKKKGGKLTTEQITIHHWANHLGHATYVVRSFQEFLLVIND